MFAKAISQILLSSTRQQQCHRKLWWWTVMQFNRIDMERTKALGYDRTTAEWVLRNGGCVRFVGSPVLFCDYNTLPPENIKFQVKEIEATSAGISQDGMIHIKGCEKLDRISLTSCPYVTDEALDKMAFRKDSLKVVEISQCKNITEEGLRYLGALTKLEKLIIRDLPYVKNSAKIEKELKEILVNCDVDIKIAQ